MNVIPPLKITDARLTSSTAVEIAPAAYVADTTYALAATASVPGSAGLITVYRSLQAANAGHAPESSPAWWASIGTTYQVYSVTATYAIGDKVLDTINHLVFESVVTGNVGQPLIAGTKWLKPVPSNRSAMFDLLRNTPTVQPGSITVVLTPGVRVDSIALVGLVANSAAVSITSGGAVVYSFVENLNLRDVSSWRDYYFRAFSTKPSVVRFDLPPYTDAVITVTIGATTGNAECGACVIGSAEFIGDVQYDAESDVLNFSAVTRDFAGGTNAMVQRRNVAKTVQQILLEKSRANRVRALRDALNATPAIWAGIPSGNDGYFEALLILGFYKKFGISLKLPTYAVISLELEEI